MQDISEASVIIKSGRISTPGMTGGLGIVGVVSATGTISGITSPFSDSGEVAGGGGMATVVAAGDWNVLSHPDTNQQPNTIMAAVTQVCGPAEFFMIATPSGALTMRSLITTVGTRRPRSIRAATEHFPRLRGVRGGELRASTEANRCF